MARAHRVRKGDVEQGFAQADVVVERTYRTQTVHQGYIEPHAVVARTNADGQSVVWCSTQGAFVRAQLLRAVLGLELSQLKVIPSEIGGGFGGKTTVYLEPIAVLLSRKTGRPGEDRDVAARTCSARPGPTSAQRRSHVKLGAKRDGTLVAAERAPLVRGRRLPRLAGAAPAR